MTLLNESECIALLSVNFGEWCSGTLLTIWLICLVVLDQGVRDIACPRGLRIF